MLVVGPPAASGLAVRGAGRRCGDEFCLTIPSVPGMGCATCEVSGCCKKGLSCECGVPCFVYAMERGTERTTTGVASGGAVDGCTNGVCVVGSVCMIGTNGVQEMRFLFSVSCGVKTWVGLVLASEWGVWGGSGGAPLGRAPGLSGRAGRPSALPPQLLGAWR